MVFGWSISDANITSTILTALTLQRKRKCTAVRVVKFSTFTAIWRKYCPCQMVMKPMTDLCATCQENSTIVLRAANKPEAEKIMVSDIASRVSSIYSHYTLDIHQCYPT